MKSLYNISLYIYRITVVMTDEADIITLTGQAVILVIIIDQQ